MESHDSKNEIKWRKNSVCLHIMNFGIFSVMTRDREKSKNIRQEKTVSQRMKNNKIR